jgi:hypothetical protein
MRLAVAKFNPGIVPGFRPGDPAGLLPPAPIIKLRQQIRLTNEDTISP